MKRGAIGIGVGIWVGIGVGIGVGGCASPAKGEAASLVAAVDRFRRAENEGKPAALPDIEAVRCSDKDVCAAKEACLAYARATASGLALKNDVQRGLADLEQKRLDPDASAARALPGKLDEASHALERGRAALPACDEKVLGLRMKFGL